MREYVWNDTEQRSCQKPPPRAETLTIRHLNTAMAKRDLGWTSLLSSRNLNEPEPFHFLNSHLERCIRAFNRADRPEPSGIVYSAFSVDCEGAVSSIRAVTTSLTADTVNCVLTQVAKTRFPPPEGGTNIVDFTLRAHQPKAAHPHAQLAP